MTTPSPVYSLRGVSKIFPGVKALSDVHLELYAGEVTALVGENGAGKSTLVKVMTGIYQPEEGEMYLLDNHIKLKGPHDAHSSGITAIHQETVLFDELSVAENIFAGAYLTKKSGAIDWTAMQQRAKEILESIDAPLNPKAILSQLSIGQKHMVAIARAWSPAPSDPGMPLRCSSPLMTWKCSLSGASGFSVSLNS